MGDSGGQIETKMKINLLMEASLKKQETVTNGACQCAAMAVGKSESIIERSFEFNITCNEEGEDKCIRFCVAMAETAKDRAPNMICEKLSGHVDNLLVRMYANVCSPPSWKYTNKEEKNPICCHEGKSIPCGNPTPSSHD
ncbi:uncharacterized protein LOC143348970 isoform X2 [Colletes latitarsis]|uniref:uncharacterized protein LOC143348970 isoform X2 n=1 Tax=Colletes latitarsis TaxID=2605962 RepID=UPI00403730B2